MTAFLVSLALGALTVVVMVNLLGAPLWTAFVVSALIGALVSFIDAEFFS